MKYEANKEPHPLCGYKIEPADKRGKKYFLVTVVQVQDNAPGWTLLPQNAETEALSLRLAGLMNDEP